MFQTPCYSMSSAFSLPYHPLCYTILCDKTWWLKILPVNSFRAIFTTFFPVYFYVFWWSFLSSLPIPLLLFCIMNDMAKILTWYETDFVESKFLRYYLNVHSKTFLLFFKWFLLLSCSQSCTLYFSFILVIKTFIYVQCF